MTDSEDSDGVTSSLGAVRGDDDYDDARRRRSRLHAPGLAARSASVTLSGIMCVHVDSFVSIFEDGATFRENRQPHKIFKIRVTEGGEGYVGVGGLGPRSQDQGYGGW